jgi:hypothetical protein
LTGTYIDAKNLSVTDGNGKKTLDIDSYGNVTIDAKGIKMDGENLSLDQYVTITDLKTGGSTTINGSNITTGTVSGDRISGGVIEGATLKTATPTSNGGVWVKENAIQLGSSSFLYDGNTFKIETNGNTSYSSTADIHLMPGMSGSTASGNGIVYVSGKVSANSLVIDGIEINPRGLTAVFG